MFLPCSLVKMQYCGEPPPPCFQVECLDQYSTCRYNLFYRKLEGPDLCSEHFVIFDNWTNCVIFLAMIVNGISQLLFSLLHFLPAKDWI